jgi:hypothetical protein
MIVNDLTCIEELDVSNQISPSQTWCEFEITQSDEDRMFNSDGVHGLQSVHVILPVETLSALTTLQKGFLDVLASVNVQIPPSGLNSVRLDFGFGHMLNIVKWENDAIYGLMTEHLYCSDRNDATIHFCDSENSSNYWEAQFFLNQPNRYWYGVEQIKRRLDELRR